MAKEVNTEEIPEIVSPTEEPTKTVETPEETLETAFGEGTAEAEEALKPPEFDWGKAGLPQYAGKSNEEIAKTISWRNRKYGEQANEIGELRKYKEAQEKIRQQIIGEPQKETPAEFNDVEEAMFVKEWNEAEKPLATLLKYLVPKLTESLHEPMFDKFKGKFGKELDGRLKDLEIKREAKTFQEKYPDYETYLPAMKELMSPEYLGEDAPFEEVHKLAKLSKEEPSLFDGTLELMQKGLSFEKAKMYTSLEQTKGTDADTKIAQVKDEIAKATPALKKTVTKQATSEPEIKTMDDAFA